MKCLTQATDDIVSDYLKTIRETQVLEPQEEQKLFNQFHNGNLEAQETIYQCNLKLVVSIAKRFMNKGVEFIDLIQEGNIGLLVAINRFDETRGFKFSTFATTWIEQKIKKAIEKTSSTIKLPAEAKSRVYKLRNALKYFDEEGLDKSISNLAAYLKLTELQVLEIIQYVDEPASLDIPLVNDELSTLGHFIPDGNSTPDDIIFGKIETDTLNAAIEHLNETEKFIITLRFDLNNGDPNTYEEIGLQLGISGEAVRQRISRILKKLHSFYYKKDKKVR
ncbi:MAG: RNA polymerase sigma factor RpoD/SigA [Bacilli bacterium]|nr:RNA polymerase sigma factor RpoD/SigA [Bacilli bacterium]